MVVSNHSDRDRMRGKDETSERLRYMDYETSLLRKEHEARKNKEIEAEKLGTLLK